MRKIVAFAALLLSFGASAADRVTISELQVGTAPAGYPAVMGIAHNNTSTTLSAVFVTFNLYDDAGNVVGNTTAAGQNIGPGENLKFSAPTLVPFSEAKVTGVKAY
ncbi:FxLYD domain-containing protein [Pseudomonas alliivorans]|nr:FxLYD domain-containing protein [Pseudomonas alliivorans]MEE4775919.1 FxLYD domain-containing protein [Pseudomonas alliivorans]MEE5042922.1 FxLYD domain-containing protein [Pseudomonas alliivorans]